MTIAESLLPEFDHEMALTRKLLERVPDEKKDWKPHEKSFSMGDLARHIATLPFWGTITFQEPELDLNPGGSPRFPRAKFESAEATLHTLDENVKTVRALIAAASDEDMMAPWTLKNNGEKMFTMPRIAVYRGFVMSHLIHHRGQLTVYLRMNDIPLPNIYGPTADEPA